MQIRKQERNYFIQRHHVCRKYRGKYKKKERKKIVELKSEFSRVPKIPVICILFISNDQLKSKI